MKNLRVNLMHANQLEIKYLTENGKQIKKELNKMNL